MRPPTVLLLVCSLGAGCADATKDDASSNDWSDDASDVEDISDAEDSLPPATFEEVLADVLVPSCGFDSCHGSGAGYLRIHGAQTEDEWIEKESTVVADLKLITPGDASRSYLIMKMEGASTIQGDIMPPSGAIATDRIARVRSWIDNLE